MDGALNRSRRDVLGAMAAVGAAALADPSAVVRRLIAWQACASAAPLGTLLGTLPLSRPGAQVQPFGVKLGGPGLDARLVTDLSTLEPDRLLTPTPQVFLRTEHPPAVEAPRRWTIEASGAIRRPTALSIFDLRRRAHGMGAHLLECSGNNNPANFGLMSVCEWTGVPLSDVVAQLRPASEATGVLIGGLDHESRRSADSVDGASWIFPLASLDRLGAFLAVRMNREPLTLDHGAPLRLVVPGWYACTWIKWVNEIRLTTQEEPATGQMKEFAARTHQAGVPTLARDYAPAEIQTAAFPIRVEKRRISSALEYRIVGIVWGGSRPVDRLAIRFRGDDPWTAFTICPPPGTHRTWALWDYRWKPATPGVYDIALSVPDPAVPQRRLASGYYVRQVRIDEI